MLGLMFLAGFALYGLLALVLMWVAARVAKHYGKPARWGWLPVFLASFLFLFWDTAPTLIAHKTLCVRNYGFTQHKSLEQWQQENPGVVETLVPIEKNDFEERDIVEIRHLNARFDWQRETKEVFLSIRRSRERLVDTKTGEVLGEYVDYFAGAGPIGLGGSDELVAFKLWLYRPGCQPKGPGQEGRSFSEFWVKAKRIGESL
jgi:hypothetical protein